MRGFAAVGAVGLRWGGTATPTCSLKTNDTDVGDLVPQVAVSSASGVRGAHPHGASRRADHSSAVWVESAGRHLAPRGRGHRRILSPCLSLLTHLMISPYRQTKTRYPASQTQEPTRSSRRTPHSTRPSPRVTRLTGPPRRSPPRPRRRRWGPDGTGASVTATTTLLDGYNNAVNDKQMEHFPGFHFAAHPRRRRTGKCAYTTCQLPGHGSRRHGHVQRLRHLR